MPLTRRVPNRTARGRYPRGWLFLAATLVLTTGLLGAVPSVGAASTDTTTEPIKFGMGPGSIDRQEAAGVAPDYGTFWVGPWTLKHGWGGPSNQLDTMRQAGVTPAIHYYYWGDDISPSCVEDGCYSSLHDAWKDRAGWQQLAEELVVELKDHMQGEPVVILLETEFNKGGISTYEPFDTYLAEKAQFLEQQYPAAEVVMPLGNWNSGAWDTFDQTAAAVEYVGLQGMRGSTRDSLSSYLNLYEATLQGVQTLERLFGKPILIHDIALSSYPEPDYLDHQANELAEFFTGMDDLKAAGVQGLIYRSWFDAPNMDLANYYGEAERHWGFERAYDGGPKPSAQVWIDGVKAERSGSTSGTTTPSGVPVSASTPASVEAEGFETKSAGGQQADSTASGGASWNLWANGYVSQGFDVQEAGIYRFDIRAQGQELDGIAPHMVVKLDGTTVLQADVPAGGWSHHAVDVEVATTGDHDLRVAFTNDGWASYGDRNLLLDKVDVSWNQANRAPSASFTVSTSDLSVSADASGSSDPDGDALSYAWDWGDGATSTGATASHTYEAAGTYTVSLTVTDPDGASGSSQDDVSVSAPLQGATVDRSGTASIEAEGFETKSAGGQQADSTASGGASWNLWSNGYIGQTFDVQEAGTYELRVRADGQELDAIAPHMVVRLDGTTLFEADVPAGGWSTYATQVDLATGVQTLEIVFTNDGWASYGDRNLLLDKVAIVPTETNSAPSASFTTSTSDLTVSTDGAGSSDPDGDALSYAWDWGDGASSTGATASHAYAAGGTYTVTLTVTDPDGASDTATQDVTVEAAAQGAIVDRSSTTGTEAEAFDTRDTGGLESDTSASGDQRWNLWANGYIGQAFDVQASGLYELRVRADGQELDAIAPHMVVRLDGTTLFEADVPAGGWNIYTTQVDLATGLQTLEIAFTNDAVSTDEDRNLLLDKVAIVPIEADSEPSTNSAPSAAFTTSTSDLSVSADASGSSDPDGDALSYAWDWGDGATSTGATASHAYAAGGTYTVTLTVTDPDGASDTATQDVTVQEPTTSIDVTAQGWKDKGRHHVSLDWTGATSDQVDIYRDGTLIATTANDGQWLWKSNNKGSGVYVFKICEAGTPTCSDPVTVWI